MKLSIKSHSFFPILLCLYCIICHCSNPASTETSPTIGSISSLANKVFTTYATRSLVRSDTVLCSIEFNSSKINALTIDATLDSAKTWIPVRQVNSVNENTIRALWIPKTDTTSDTINYRYVGDKKAYFRIVNMQTGQQVLSDTFTVLGRIPFELLSPHGKDTIQMNDTLFIRYRANKDLFSKIQVFFMNSDMPNWKEILNNSSSGTSPLFTYTTTFLPSSNAADAQNFQKPFTILLKDYNPSLPYYVQSDSIFVAK